MHALFLPMLLIASLSAPVDATAAEGTRLVAAAGAAQSSSSIQYGQYAFRNVVFSFPTGCEMELVKEEAGTREHEMRFYPGEEMEGCVNATIFISENEMPWEYSIQEVDNLFLRNVTFNNDSTALLDWYLPSYTPLRDTEDTQMLGLPARRYSYTGEWKSKALRGESVYVAKGNSVYHVTMYTWPEIFERDRTVFDEIVRSMAFKAPTQSSSSSRAPSVLPASLLTPPVASSSSQAAIPSFADVSSDHPFSSAIRWGAEQGYQGYPDGTFRPDQPLNRAELAKLVTCGPGSSADACHPKAEAECGTAEAVRATLASFSDVDPAAWYAPYVCKAKVGGLISGYPDGTFRPANRIRFVEAAKIIAESAFSRGTLVRPAAASGPWYRPYMEALVGGNGSVPDSVTTFEHELTRGEFVEMQYRNALGITTKPSMRYDGAADRLIRRAAP